MHANDIIRDGNFNFPDRSTLPEDGRPEFNRLVFTSSPYLLQHARNPVDWFPWGPEAFERAQNEDKPVFLSIGYSTCHWCHVMEHESFEDAEVAALLNERYISIKVDREERPDIDHIYMTVCQAMTGAGGWPLSVFLTPDMLPFFAGTYFPKTDRMGRPGFTRVLKSLHDAWKNDRNRVLSIGGELRDRLREASDRSSSDLPSDMLDRAVQAFKQSHDPVHGGFGSAPKFPMGHTLSFLLGREQITGNGELGEIVERSLLGMYRGGLWDHLGGGFCRYSTDSRWLVPHFEKMLYDNALLLMAYADGYASTKITLYADVCKGIAAYVAEYLTDDSGVFYSAENADSEGEEGRFYVFTRKEFREIVDTRYSAMLEEYFGVEDAGNFEHGNNILHVALNPEQWRARHGLSEANADSLLEATRLALKNARSKRVHPSLDDKILASWNGLMIAGLAHAGRLLGDVTMIQSARTAADALLQRMLTPDGHVLHRMRNDEVGIDGFLEDYAFVAWGLIELYAATFQLDYLERAVSLVDIMLDLFGDASSGALRFSSRSGEVLIANTVDLHDGALPSGNGAAALVLARLARLTGRTDLENRAVSILRAAASSITAYPTGSAVFLMALEILSAGSVDVVLSGTDVSGFLDILHQRWQPSVHILHRPSGLDADRLAVIAPFTADMIPRDGKPTAYVCRNYSCEAPITDPAKFAEAIARV